MEAKATRAGGFRCWMAHQQGDQSHSHDVEDDWGPESTVSEGVGHEASRGP